MYGLSRAASRYVGGSRASGSVGGGSSMSMSLSALGYQTARQSPQSLAANASPQSVPAERAGPVSARTHLQLQPAARKVRAELLLRRLHQRNVAQRRCLRRLRHQVVAEGPGVR